MNGDLFDPLSSSPLDSWSLYGSESSDSSESSETGLGFLTFFFFFFFFFGFFRDGDLDELLSDLPSPSGTLEGAAVVFFSLISFLV